MSRISRKKKKKKKKLAIVCPPSLPYLWGYRSPFFMKGKTFFFLGLQSINTPFRFLVLFLSFLFCRGFLFLFFFFVRTFFFSFFFFPFFPFFATVHKQPWIYIKVKASSYIPIWLGCVLVQSHLAIPGRPNSERIRPAQRGIRDNWSGFGGKRRSEFTEIHTRQ
ncbi:hypothetical protein HOY80DRAFT_621313 [Tuber brumale]|nr:hypothetical protein HOY80DRAFT_621313 [Tuber brumale]